ncbi:hypothetical protein [Haliovirga abyssi]|uniref:Uncharacterized protein n=1 Tax=Haliovirga abyssi TaxID=2996794 RepID=A0AAU9D4J8_9FUSO|nr:hypothetical protein [Haliovirga abyssi]BDU50951.1 hypothetical protein HLVA_15200 [Haliovirga abyssi]
MDRKDRIKINIYKELLEEEKAKNRLYKRGIVSMLLFLVVTVGYFGNNFRTNIEGKNLAYVATLYQENVNLEDTVNVNLGTKQSIYDDLLGL